VLSGLARPARPARIVARASTGTLASVTVPQAWHSPHRPAHLVLRQPHSEHSYSAAAGDFPMAGSVSAGTDSGCRSLTSVRRGSLARGRGSQGGPHKLAGRSGEQTRSYLGPRRGGN
jgi:hypothetical protein